jgi:hypothetical protein
MKKPLSQAAASLSIHPLNLLRYLAEIQAPFEEVWPEVDDAWIETVRGQDREHFGSISRVEQPNAVDRDDRPERRNNRLSDEAARILEKMWRQRRWGDLGVSLDTVRKHYSQVGSDADSAVRELVDLGLIVGDGPRGPFSLNPSKKAEIERIAAALVAHR